MNSKQRIGNLYELIKAAGLDPAVGIRIAHLTGNEHFSLFAAELAPRKKIAAHYHKSGVELYQLVEGEGLMYTGKPGNDGSVAWNPPFSLKKGDCITVSEGEVHQLFNASDNKIVIVFGCSKSHLSNDRIVVKGFDG